MKVEILSATSAPIEVISLAAGTCYGKHDVSAKRVESCYKAGHMSVFEHASVTFRISGISRACSHQLVRHRVASYSQQSQRYCKIDVSRDDWFVIPEGVVDVDAFVSHMYECAMRYNAALDAGVRPEDARYLLPEACKTEIVVSMNLRELFHFFDTRMSQRAQWEIRALAKVMHDELWIYRREWAQLMEMYDGVAYE